MLSFKDDNINLILKQAREDEDDSLARELSTKLNLPIMDLTAYPIEFGALGTIEEGESREGQIAPFHRAGKRLFVAGVNPGLPRAQAIIEKLKKSGYLLTVFVTTKKSMARAWERYKDLQKSTNVASGIVSVNSSMIDEYVQNIHSVEDFIEVSTKALEDGKQSITKIFEIILAGAYALHASDIHIEPEEDEVRIRFRLDGVLHNVLGVPTSAYHFFKSRLKILSGVKLNQVSSAQDGRFTIDITHKEIEVRVSIIPGHQL